MYADMTGFKLTREAILDGTLRAASRNLHPPGTRFMSDDERCASIGEIIAAAPNPDRIWVFGYGSLIWNPAFHFAERRTARIHGFHRQFCLLSRTRRGTPERPGLDARAGARRKLPRRPLIELRRSKCIRSWTYYGGAR
jgi:cation transport protein ChaC